MPAPDQLTSRRLSRFRSFELIARSVVEGFVTGLHRSPFKGFAVEFSEHRPYTPGDDIKHLDWKVFGKNEKFFVRQYEEDTSLRAFLILDSSGSMGYQTGKFSKLDFGKFICGVFAYVLFQQSDSVGAVVFDSNIRSLLSPANSRQHLKRILDTLNSARPGKRTELAMVLHRLANRLRRRALIVIVSDFFADSRGIIKALTHFSHRHHEVIVFQVLDREELTFPFTEQTKFEGLEGDPDILVDPVRIRSEYQRQFAAHQTDICKACHRLHIDFRQVVTDEPFDKTMAKFFAERMT